MHGRHRTWRSAHSIVCVRQSPKRWCAQHLAARMLGTPQDRLIDLPLECQDGDAATGQNWQCPYTDCAYILARTDAPSTHQAFIYAPRKTLRLRAGQYHWPRLTPGRNHYACRAVHARMRLAPSPGKQSPGARAPCHADAVNPNRPALQPRHPECAALTPLPAPPPDHRGRRTRQQLRTAHRPPATRSANPAAVRWLSSPGRPGW